MLVLQIRGLILGVGIPYAKGGQKRKKKKKISLDKIEVVKILLLTYKF